ncbi:MATE family efflux transporter [Pseudorhodoplanes sinuspersici]|uniref:MATE family efflux transporter n=1 Tax=Pseudorhodoplanes sinuspersici TaxID=1235591 RepID=A0A1W6ZZR6_9HYPH|nr:MATE family efflux transporter [Pseudorhodoplanes sinuspersici]ARQ02864.1 MATE family efflux transporter [Pseudorhodoplanes sinuspersici]RKE70234.1 putative MATE family efflux protein [Pseudorhodoplanes sinuspersici]
MDPRTRALLEAPIGRTILRLAMPNVAVMVIQAAIGLVETYFIAKLGTDALAGLALVFPVQMLFVMITAGAMGGGILSAVARALGSGNDDNANALAWQSVWIALSLGLLTTFVVILIAPLLYGAMGGKNGSLSAALIYSNVVFAGAIPLWLYNSLAAVIRGTGNMFVPAAVTAVGAVILIPLSPILIFGFGPLPGFGIAGGAAAVVVFYVVGSAVFAYFVWSGRGVLQPSLKPQRFRWSLARGILKIGLLSSIASISTNLTIATATALVGFYGPAAVAGFGTAVRLEYLLVPLVFGLGAPVASMVGTNIGAGQNKRALRIAWTGAAISGVITGLIGAAAAVEPHLWLSLFGEDATMNAVGSLYLRIVGPFYGFFGVGLALYFAAQGAGRVGWAMAASLLRVAIAALGGLLMVRLGAGTAGVFAALAAALAIYGVLNVIAVASGVWFRGRETKVDGATALKLAPNEGTT